MTDELARIADALERVARALEGHQADAFSPDDRDLLARLLPAIGALLGSEWLQVTRLDEYPELEPLLGGRSAKSLGRLFARCQGVDFGGYIVERHPGNGRLWRALSKRF